jgi:hypothetical protein
MDHIDTKRICSRVFEKLLAGDYLFLLQILPNISRSPCMIGTHTQNESSERGEGYGTCNCII